MPPYQGDKLVQAAQIYGLEMDFFGHTRHKNIRRAMHKTHLLKLSLDEGQQPNLCEKNKTRWL